MTATRLVLVRHGQTAWNVEGRYQGQADPPLNAQGKAQAEALADRLAAAETQPVGVYASPLRRAWRTAEAIARRWRLPLRPEPRLMEIHLGSWQGVLAVEIARRWPERFARWEREPWEVRPPGGETLAEVQQRVNAALDDILRRHAEETVVLVAHRLPLAFAKIRFQGLDPLAVRRIPIPNAGYEVIEVPS
ncbi:MAG TPA: histidine phosphatase family protein [Anaerolineae bacterium]|nr:histidine phosphatase family protein [Anaerolineae bacterium]HID84263.1 histidine phosphatase family protein [Anaerolineales bacterium]HIQ09149.1 histidine phosphatase family protein [Anaerolineaceae bacterium]